MSDYAFRILFPIWIGIGGNLLLMVCNATLAFKEWPIARWYFEGSGFVKIVVAMWAVALLWSALNAWYYR
jgi:hypothetical protein